MIAQKIEALRQLSEKLQDKNDTLLHTIHKSNIENPWFTEEHVALAIEGISMQFLDEIKLRKWTSAYTVEDLSSLQVGLILAGNIPFVGFHDILCCFVSHASTKIKLSEKDKHLTKYVVDTLQKSDPTWDVTYIDQLSDVDAVIATGSNNTHRYFEYYFRNIPHILRKNRTSIAVLTGNESSEELLELGKDICLYFGLGCRNVSKIYVPKGYDVNQLLKAVSDFEHFHQHKLYMDNYDYNRTLLMMNKVPHVSNPFLIIQEDPALYSRLATIHVEYYNTPQDVQNDIIQYAEDIQIIVSHKNELWDSIPFGKSQQPELWNYADNTDTMEFLSGL